MFFKDNIYIKNIEILVQDLEMMTGFYETIIGLEVINKNENSVSLGIDNNVLLILTENKHAVLNNKHTGLYHMAFLLPEMSDLGKVIKHIVMDNEYPLQGASNHLVSNAIYLEDPEGNGIEIYADIDSSDWEFTNGEIEMATLPMDVNYVMEIRDTSDFINLPANTKLGHVHFTINNINEANKYFHDVLGFDLLLNFNEQALFLSSNNYHHHIGANIWEGRNIKNRNQYDTGLISYHLNIKDKDSFVKRLEENNITVNDNSFIDPYGLTVYFWGEQCKNIKKVKCLETHFMAT